MSGKDSDNDGSERELNEEYKVWKKNCPYMYDWVLSSALEWPTLTTEWFPDYESHPEKGYSSHRLLLGTHTSGNDQDYLQIASVNLPMVDKTEIDVADYDEITGEIAKYKGTSSKIKIIQRIDHEGEVNKARYMPQNPDIIATMTNSGDALIFDRTKHSLHPSGTCNPQIRLVHHTREGYGLAWNPHKEGNLLSGAGDNTVALWDIKTNFTRDKNKQTMKPVSIFKNNTAIVNDVSWHNTHAYLFATASDDLSLQILDTRSNNKQPIEKVRAHDEPVNSVSFSPASEYLLATGSADSTIGLWDLRKLSIKLHSLIGHNKDVTTVEWNPNFESILASGSGDRRIIIWDLSKIGFEQTPEDAEDGVAELLFMHGGHTNSISDFSWNKNLPWTIASAADDNLLQIWRVAESIVGENENENGDNDNPSPSSSSSNSNKSPEKRSNASSANSPSKKKKADIHQMDLE